MYANIERERERVLNEFHELLLSESAAPCIVLYNYSTADSTHQRPVRVVFSAATCTTATAVAKEPALSVRVCVHSRGRKRSVIFLHVAKAYRLTQRFERPISPLGFVDCFESMVSALLMSRQLLRTLGCGSITSLGQLPQRKLHG